MVSCNTVKRCTKCGVEKPLDAFYVRLSRAKSGGPPRRGDGRVSICAECCRTRWWAHDGESSAAKRCTGCTRVLPRTVEFFYPHRPTADHLNPRCRDCRRKESRDNYRLAEDKPKRIAAAVAWGRKYPEKRHVYTARHHRSHPETAFANGQNRRARQRDAFVERIERRVVFERDRGMCGLCPHPVAWADASVDHILPLARGGLHSYANVQLAHRLCNARKGAQLIGGLACSCEISAEVLA